MPKNQQSRAIEKQKMILKNDRQLQGLIDSLNELELAIARKFPQVYVTNELIKQAQKAAREKLATNPEFILQT